AIREAGGIVSLVKLFSSDSKDAHRNAATVLAILAYTNLENRTAIREAGGIAPLVSLLSSALPKTQEKAVVVLRNLSLNNPENRTAIREAGGIVPLVNLLNSDSQDLQLLAARVLMYLAKDNSENQIAIREEGGIIPLVSLLIGSDCKEIQNSALKALLNLASNEENRADISTYVEDELSEEEGVLGWRIRLEKKAGFEVGSL
ncbi:hypothetical protein OAJ27_00485, partial [bacterium]|nr:hypothetical protein [bacterium]